MSDAITGHEPATDLPGPGYDNAEVAACGSSGPAGEPQTPGSDAEDEGRALGGLNNAQLPGPDTGPATPPRGTDAETAYGTPVAGELCPYCGHAYPPGREASAEEIGAHLKECPGPQDQPADWLARPWPVLAPPSPEVQAILREHDDSPLQRDARKALARREAGQATAVSEPLTEVAPLLGTCEMCDEVAPLSRERVCVNRGPCNARWDAMHAWRPVMLARKIRRAWSR